MEVKDVTRCAFMAPDPKLITINLAEHEQRMTEHRAKMEELNPPKIEPAEKELRRLRRELFVIEENAKHLEIYTNNIAGTVKLLDERINIALKEKKAYAANGNDLAERGCEHTIQRLERERAEAEKEFQRARRNSAAAAAHLRAFPHHERIAELTKSL